MLFMFAMAAVGSGAEDHRFGHDRCGGIPGGMYDRFERIGSMKKAAGLVLRMHRYTMDDANALNLAVVFLDAAGRPLRRWRGEPSRSSFVDVDAAWVTTVTVPIPEGAFAAHLFDLHYDRRCVLLLATDGDVLTTEVGVAGAARAQPAPRPPPLAVEEGDETLDEQAVKVKRSGRARAVKREIEDAPDDLEARAKKLADLKRNLAQLTERQVLEWMGFQGLEPEDADVMEMLGPDWGDRCRK